MGLFYDASHGEARLHHPQDIVDRSVLGHVHNDGLNGLSIQYPASKPDTAFPSVKNRPFLSTQTRQCLFYLFVLNIGALRAPGDTGNGAGLGGSRGGEGFSTP